MIEYDILLFMADTKLRIMETDEGSKQEDSDPLLDGKHVLPTTGIRHSILHGIEVDGFLRSYYGLFLPAVSIISWAVYALCFC